MNELDAKILKNLLNDGRISYEELAKVCETSKNKVWKRCRSMEKKGLIKGATTQINLQVFGFTTLATFLICVDSQQIEEIMRVIEKITEIKQPKIQVVGKIVHTNNFEARPLKKREVLFRIPWSDVAARH